MAGWQWSSPRRQAGTIPAHPLLATLIGRRTRGKRPDDYLFEDLPEQAPGSKRDRSAPVSQSFTRERRRLGVEEKGSATQRQSNTDFHSWRRWFIRRAVSGLEKGAIGYTPWTIASVVGHKVEGGKIEGIALPLGMTMGHYAGAASWEAMMACVNAVSLPEGTLIDRTDLAGDLVGGRGLRRRKRPLSRGPLSRNWLLSEKLRRRARRSLLRQLDHASLGGGRRR